jgi:ABC-2 type transport system permease protein
VLVTGVVGTVQEITTQQGHGTLGEYVGLLGPFTLVDGVQGWLFGAEPSAGVVLHGNLVGAAHLVTTLVVVAGCFGALLLRYRKVAS